MKSWMASVESRWAISSRESRVTEWKGTKQLRVTRIRHANRDDGLVPADFYKSAPEDSESMYTIL